MPCWLVSKVLADSPFLKFYGVSGREYFLLDFKLFLSSDVLRQMYLKKRYPAH